MIETYPVLSGLDDLLFILCVLMVPIQVFDLICISITYFCEKQETKTKQITRYPFICVKTDFVMFLSSSSVL